MDLHALFCSVHLQHFRTVLSQFIKIQTLKLHFRLTVVQFGQTQNIVDQRKQPVRTAVYALCKTGDVPLRRQPGLDQLRVPGNSRQRRLQLMGHICGKLLPDPGIPDQLPALLPDLFDQRFQVLVSPGFPLRIRSLGQPLNGIDKFSREKMGHSHAHQNQHCQDPENIREHAAENTRHALRVPGRPKHTAVLQTYCIIKGIVGKRPGPPHGFPFPGFHGLPYLRPVPVVFQKAAVRLIVEENLSLPIHQRQTNSAACDPRSGSFPPKIRTGLPNQQHIFSQIADHLPAEQILIHPREQSRRQQNRQKGNHCHHPVNPFSHRRPLSLIPSACIPHCAPF